MPATSARLASSYWPADRSQPLLDTTVGDLLRAAAAQVPGRLALVEGSADPAARRTWTYAELLAVAERAARALLARFAPGERIAVWAPNCPEWMLLQHGVSLAGMVLVTVNPALRAAGTAVRAGPVPGGRDLLRRRLPGLRHGRRGGQPPRRPARAAGGHPAQ